MAACRARRPDGNVIGPSDPERSRLTADLVEDMLKQLATQDQSWRPYWDKRMVWYGPGGLGSYATVDAFAKFQSPFEETFEGWATASAKASPMSDPAARRAMAIMPSCAAGRRSPACM